MAGGLVARVDELRGRKSQHSSAAKIASRMDARNALSLSLPLCSACPDAQDAQQIKVTCFIWSSRSAHHTCNSWTSLDEISFAELASLEPVQQIFTADDIRIPRRRRSTTNIIAVLDGENPLTIYIYD